MRISLGLFSLISALGPLAQASSALAQTLPLNDWRVTPTAPTDLALALPEGISLSSPYEARFSGAGYQDRLSLTTRPLPSSGDLSQPWTLTPDQQDASVEFRYRRDWEGARGYTPSGLEISLTPHAGLGVADGDPTAEAGATLRIGQGLNQLARDGSEAFGERPRWYVYAAGSKRAFGYNFARDRDGSFNRSGVTHDKGTYLGDASIGVAYRRGPVHTAFGVVYREIEAKGLRGLEGMRDEVSEGLVAFQLSIRPQ